MKKKSLFLLLAVIFALFMSCDLLDNDPQFRIYVDSTLGNTYGTVYGALGTYDSASNSFSESSSWVSAGAGGFSSYASFPSGSYTVLRDYDSDHGIATVFTTFLYSFEEKKKYTVAFNSSGGFIISED